MRTHQYLSFRLKCSLKESFCEFCASCGLTLTDAISMLVNRVVRTGEVPFKVEPFYIYWLVYDLEGDERTMQLTIRMERELLEQFDSSCEAIGVSKSTMLKMYFIRCLNDNCLPFWGN